jgi:hypothetical protein
MGFMGMTYYMTPAGPSEIWSPKLAWQFGTWLSPLSPWWATFTVTQARLQFQRSSAPASSQRAASTVEAPRWADLVIVAVMLMYIFNVG